MARVMGAVFRATVGRSAPEHGMQETMFLVDIGGISDLSLVDSNAKIVADD
jgi:hypothetical protein